MPLDEDGKSLKTTTLNWQQDYAVKVSAKNLLKGADT